MRAIRRRLFQGEADDLGDLLIVDRARSPGARFVVEAVEPMLGKAPTPLADRVRVGTLRWPRKIGQVVKVYSTV